MKVYPLISSSTLVTVSGTSAEFTSTNMASGEIWEFVSSTLCYIKQGAAGVTASDASGSMLVPANTRVQICGSDGARLAVIQHTAGGSATLTKLHRNVSV